MTRIRVAHLISALGVGGAENMLLNLVRRLDGDRFESRVITLLDADGPLAAELAAAGTPVVGLGVRRDPLALPRLVRLLRSWRPAILQSWLYHADLVAALVGRPAGVPAIFWNLRCSDFGEVERSARLRWLLRALRLVSPLPDVVIANSERGRAAHERLGYRCREWQIVPNGFDTGVYRPAAGDRAATRARLGLGAGPVIVMVARHEPPKDHDSLLRALAVVRARFSAAELLLVGKGVAALTQRTAALGLGGAVHLAGERRDVPDILAACDVAVLSSLSEGFPNVVGEAMACGLPCVATDVGEAAALIGDTGRIVPPARPDALAAALIDLLALEPAARAELGAAARRRIVERYGLDRAVARYAALYEAHSAGRQAATQS